MYFKTDFSQGCLLLYGCTIYGVRDVTDAMFYYVFSGTPDSCGFYQRLSLKMHKYFT